MDCPPPPQFRFLFSKNLSDPKRAFGAAGRRKPARVDDELQLSLKIFFFPVSLDDSPFLLPPPSCFSRPAAAAPNLSTLMQQRDGP